MAASATKAEGDAMSCIVAGSPGLADYLTACADAMRAAAAPELEREFNRAVEAIVDSLRAGKPFLICGNGGSMADAQHIAGELVARFLLNRKALPVIALGSNAATLTAWGNDVAFSTVFAREVEAFGTPGGALLAISTSGNSGNVMEAIAKARDIGMTVIGLTGGKGGKMAQACDILISPQVAGTPTIQELHTPIFHLLCREVEARCAEA
jgi:D-sedoheptulose 7-phosphate isomerase